MIFNGSKTQINNGMIQNIKYNNHFLVNKTIIKTNL